MKMERICSCKFFSKQKDFLFAVYIHDILITIFYVYFVTLHCSDTSIMIQDFFKNIFRVYVIILYFVHCNNTNSLQNISNIYI